MRRKVREVGLISPLIIHGHTVADAGATTFWCVLEGRAGTDLPCSCTHTLPLLWQVRYSLLPYILLPDKQVLVKYKEVYIQMQSE